MIKTQVQIPDELFRQAKEVAAAKEWSFAEIVRRGLEYMVSAHPIGRWPRGAWRLPASLDLGLESDPFAEPAWREDLELTSGAARMIAGQLREQAARYDAGT